MLHVAWLDVVWVACHERHIFALLIFKTDLPAIQKFRSWLDVGELGILEWPLKLSTDYVLKAVV